MPIIPLSCPNCGAKLQANSDDPILTCESCGTASVMKDAIVHNYIQNTINISANTVNVVNQKDFEIEAGVLKNYKGESVDVVIPENVYEIAEAAFSTLKIRSIKFSHSVTIIGSEAFKDCKSLESVQLSESIKTIGIHSFEGCSSLTSISLPSSVTEITMGAFEKCSSLASINIPSSITVIGIGAFENCNNLQSLTIPDSVRQIKPGAFRGCSKLATITITNRDIQIAYNAFADCPSLSSITAPDNILYSNAFPGTPYYEKYRATLMQSRRAAGKCQHCGGTFIGVLSKKCATCSKPKDY